MAVGADRGKRGAGGGGPSDGGRGWSEAAPASATFSVVDKFCTLTAEGSGDPGGGGKGEVARPPTTSKLEP